MGNTAVAQLFGTDGIRGRAGIPPLDPETLAALGAVIGRLIRENRSTGSSTGVILGHDGRASAAMIRCALSAGILSEGLDAWDAGLVTTPALAHETRLGNFSAGIMISASHNPAQDNGIKIFGSNGCKIADELEQKIEFRMHVRKIREEPCIAGNARRLELGAARYRDFITSRFRHLDLDSTRIVVDCANGGSATLAPEILEGLGVDILRRNDAPDGLNINRECGALHPDAIAAEVARHECRLGLCLDGDGDRAILIDERGQTVHGDALLTLLAINLNRVGTLAGGAAAVTVMSNLGLKKALSTQGIRVVETPVGDRSVMAAMRNEDLTLGGENSGHVIFGEEHNFTGDGLYTCLKTLEVMQATGATLSELASAFTLFPQLLVNVPVKEKPDLATLPAVSQACQKVENRLGEDGRVLLRYSGTEDLCRVMVEAPTDELAKEMADILVDAVEKSLG